MGRQPWTVLGLLKTPQAVTPSTGVISLVISLAGFMVLYFLLGLLELFLLWRGIKSGPPSEEQLTEDEEGELDLTYSRLPMSQPTLDQLLVLRHRVLLVRLLFLEGSDFGVGMLLPLLGRERRARSAMIGSIDPVWDGYEVWLIVAVGATFAAFPKWYATVLSACYPVLFLTLVTLILRVVAFEFRGKASARWRRWWERALVLGSLVPPLAWGLILTVQLTGLPITAQGTFTGRPWDVLAAVPILGAVAFAVLCVLHGATYLSLRTTHPLAGRPVVWRRWSGYRPSCCSARCSRVFLRPRTAPGATASCPTPFPPGP